MVGAAGENGELQVEGKFSAVEMRQDRQLHLSIRRVLSTVDSGLSLLPFWCFLCFLLAVMPAS